MKCVKCGMELSTQMLRADGALQCPSCGAVYRRKKSTDSSSGVDSSESYPSKQEVQRKETSYETRNSSNQHIRNTVDADQSMNSAVRAKLASVAEKATETKKSIVERGNAHSTAKAIASDEIRNNRHKSHDATIPIILALVVVLGFGIFGYAFSHFIDGNPPSAISSIFKSKDSKEINDLMKRMEKAYNAQDVYALLQLYDPTYTDAMFGMMNLIGLNGDTFKSVLPFASQIISQYNSNSSTDSGKITVKLLDYSVNGTTGTAKYQVDFSFKDGSKDTLTQTADIVKVDDKWYFSYFPSTVGSVATTDNSSVSTDAQPTATGPIPVAAGLTESDVAGDLYYIKGKKADGTDGWGVINAQGKEIIAPYFTDIMDFDGNCFAVTLDGINWGFIDRHGNLVCDYKLQGESRILRGPDQAGYYAIYDKSTESYGLYNPTTDKIVPCQYQDVGSVNENGLFPAMHNDYWGIVDVDGNIHADFKYKTMDSEIHGDRIGVWLNNARGAIDVNGNIIVPLSTNYYGIEVNKNGFIFVNDELAGHHGQVYDRNGNHVFTYDQCEQLADGRFLAGEGLYYDTEYPHYYLFDVDGTILADSDLILAEFLSQNPEEKAEYNACHMVPCGEDYIVVRLYAQHPYFFLMDSKGNKVMQCLLEDADARIDDYWQFRRAAFVPLYYISLLADGKYLVCSSNINMYDEPQWTRVYSLETDQCVTEYPISMKARVMLGNLLICQSHNTSNQYYLRSLDGTVSQDLKSVDVYSDGNNIYAYLSDGVYYGVLTDQGFVGKGITYSEISYDGDTRTFILNDGANQETYRYNPDGTITQLS